MQMTPLAQFELNLDRAKHLVQLGTSLEEITTEAIDLSDLLRAALVLGVSALDHFVHEYVRIEMLATFAGLRPATRAYEKFLIPMQAVNSALATTEGSAWLDNAIRLAHGWRSFQHPDKIKDAIALISPVNLWNAVADELGTDPSATKTELVLIIDRRNKIAHEADMDPTYPGVRWPISESLVIDALSFLEALTRAIEVRT